MDNKTTTTTNRSDVDSAVRVLTNSFYDNKSVNFAIGKKGDKKKKVQELVRYAFLQCFASKLSLKTADDKAYLLALIPGKSGGGLAGWLATMRVIFRATGIMGAYRMLRRKKKIEEHYPKNDFCYLWFIGVDSDSQGKHRGSQLLSALEERCYELGLSIYLETSTLSNLGFYKKHGYMLIREINIEDCGFPIYAFYKSLDDIRVDQRQAG